MLYPHLCTCGSSCVYLLDLNRSYAVGYEVEAGSGSWGIPSAEHLNAGCEAQPFALQQLARQARESQLRNSYKKSVHRPVACPPTFHAPTTAAFAGRRYAPSRNDCQRPVVTRGAFVADVFRSYFYFRGAEIPYLG